MRYHQCLRDMTLCQNSKIFFQKKKITNIHEMPSLFLPPSAFSSSEIIIENEQAHYLTNVLRLQKGQNITLFDGCGNRYHARCVSFTKKEVRLIVMSTEKVDSLSPSLSIILAQAVIKSSKMDLIIEKA